MQLRALTAKHWFFCFSLLALFLVYELYGPTLQAPYIFDDWELPYTDPGLRNAPLSVWIGGNRPLLMLSFWLNMANDPAATGAYHSVNVLIHLLNSILVFAILRRLLPERNWLPAGIAAVFLVHPLQTESVAYIAGRSESLAAFFCLASYAVFLHRPPEGSLSWGRTAAILSLYGAGILTKENAVVLPALFLLTDLLIPGASVRRNLRLYVPVCVLGVVGLGMVARILAASHTAGFHSHVATWDQYAMTQARAVPHYLALAVLPLWQSMDHDFPISRSFGDHGTWLYFMLLLSLTGAAFFFRRQYPLAALGFFWILICLAPTSSFIPIADPFVERRMYLALVGVLFVASETLRRYQPPPVAVVACLMAFSFLTYARNMVLSNPLVLWVETVKHGTGKGRPYDFLADAAVNASACPDVAPFLDDALQRLPKDFHVLRGAAKVLECLNKPDEATALLRRAVAVQPTSAEAYEMLGLAYGEMNRLEPAREALETALRLKPDSPGIRMSMAMWYQAANDMPNAAASFRRVLELEPHNTTALTALRRIEANAN